MFSVRGSFAVLFVFLILLLTLVSSSNAANNLLGSTGNAPGPPPGLALLSITKTTGLGAPIAPAGTLGPVTDIVSRSDDIVFGTTGFNSPAPGPSLIIIDPCSGVETLIGPTIPVPPFPPINVPVNALEFAGGALYGAAFNVPGSDLVMVDDFSGALIPIAPILIGGVTPVLVHGMAYDQFSGIMYGISSLFGPPNLPSDLITIDLNSGFAALIGPTGFTGIRALEFDSAGTLYGGTSQASLSPGFLITINPATGTGTPVGPTGWPAISGLAEITDTDSDNIPDVCDTDNDNDGVPDGSDPQPLNPDICGNSDGDTCDDCVIGTDDFGPLSDSTPNNDGTDTDSDGMCDLSDTDDDNDGVPDGSDPQPLNPDICGNSDGDTCDDCIIGTDNFGPLSDSTPNNDGTDTDSDGMCDLSDTDDDNDGVLDVNDTDPLNPDVCEDVDADTCDDCAVGTDDFGPLPDNDPFNDGFDVSGDGICNAGLPIPAVNNWGMIIFLVVAGLVSVYYLRKRNVKG